MSDNYDTLSDDELIALAKYKTQGADALSDNELTLAAKHLAPKESFLDSVQKLGKNALSIPALATDMVYGAGKAAVSTGMAMGARAYGSLTGQNDVPLNKLLEASSEDVEKAAPSVGSMTGLDQQAPYKAVMNVLDPLLTAPKKLGDLTTNLTGSGDLGGTVESYMNVLGIPGLHYAGSKAAKGMFALEEKLKPTPSEAKVSGVVNDLVATKEATKLQEQEAAKAAEMESPAYKAQQEIEARQAALEQDVRSKTPPVEQAKAQEALVAVQEKAVTGEATPVEVAQAKQIVEAVNTPETVTPAVAIDFSKKAQIDQIGKTLGDLLPELSRDAKTPDEAIAHLKTMPDIQDKGLIKKGVSSFTKGFLFEKLKTNNPGIKYAHNIISDAVDKYTLNNKILVEEHMAPALRELSTNEKIEVSNVLQQAMREKVAVTPELLAKHGFTENQTKAITTLQETHVLNEQSINKSREAAGKGPIPTYTGYMLGMAKGNFKRVIYKDVVGDNGVTKQEVVGIVGSNVRGVLEKRVNDLLAKHPEYRAAGEQYNGVVKKRGGADSLQEALLLISDHNPNMEVFGQALHEILSNESYNSLGATKHTKGKKGVFGMEGNKEWRSAKENADDFFQAQIEGTQLLSKWAALSDASRQINKVLADPELATTHPNTLKAMKDYLDNAMGKNPSEIGKSVDMFIGSVGDQLGLGPSVARAGIHSLRSLVNTVFFTFNPKYYAANTIQPFIALPPIKAFLDQRGISVNLDATAWTDLTAKGYSLIAKRSMPKNVADLMPDSLSKLSKFEEKIIAYGDAHGQSSSQVVITQPHVTKDASYYYDKMVQGPIGRSIEGVPRAATFATISKMLAEAGFEKDPQIFPMARQLTDLVMGDYRHHEQATIHNSAGMVGGISRNLTSYPLHQNGLITFLGREAINGKGSKAFNVALLSALAIGGVQGMYAYDEANFVVTHLSEMLASKGIGKPTTLDKLVLDSAEKMNKSVTHGGDFFASGAAAWAGIDFHGSVGKSMLPGFTGGTGKAVDIAKDVGTLVSEPLARGWNIKMLAKDIGGAPATIAMEHAGMLSQQLPNGQTIAIDKHGESNITLNEEDKRARAFGFRGVNEASESSRRYALSRADKYYEDAQKSILTSVTKEIADTHGKIPPEDIKKMASKYVDNQGDINNFITHLVSKGVAINTNLKQELIMRNSSGSLPGAYRLQRRMEQ